MVSYLEAGSSPVGLGFHWVSSSLNADLTRSLCCSLSTCCLFAKLRSVILATLGMKFSRVHFTEALRPLSHHGSWIIMKKCCLVSAGLLPVLSTQRQVLGGLCLSFCDCCFCPGCSFYSTSLVFSLLSWWLIFSFPIETLRLHQTMLEDLLLLLKTSCMFVFSGLTVLGACQVSCIPSPAPCVVFYQCKLIFKVSSKYILSSL